MMIMPYLYILECADGTYYTGSTWNLEKRLWQHQNGQGANYTKKRLPVKVVYCEEFERIEDAFLREKQVQGWSHKKKLALIERNAQRLHELAECQNETHWSRHLDKLASTPLGDRLSCSAANCSAHRAKSR
ncbi:GIY-YIG catalytic domain protein [Candidatus Vecturithrix granuli]|uniref:GIY-YIG catalytic domain protein n=1 Tax=Vecturithrix granuli TaxID=1499967 RepID=A0A081BUS8_VECG1|nr:GIY-YIG catalytic domain protein [Candidatus Vecturithrix granuli]